MDKESFDKIVSAIEDAGEEAREYSGRGMYGKTCLSVHCHNPLSFVMQLVSSLCENAEDLSEVQEVVDALSDPSTDSMGRGGVIYWSGIPWLSEDEDDGEDDGVEVCTEEYEENYGKKPSGHGSWAFFPDGVEDADKALWFNGEYREARAKAVKAANEQGIEMLLVGT